MLESLKPIQLAHFDFDGYIKARQEFTTDEWIDTLIQSIGFNPEMFGKRSKLLQLVRLIPFVESFSRGIETLGTLSQFHRCALFSAFEQQSNN